jgi:hypothetical protein
MAMRSLTLVFACAGALLGCSHQKIPNTDVEDTEENREIVLFMEKYRRAVETRDVPTLVSMASRHYYDDMGTPTGDDDVDYDALVDGLKRLKNDVADARYQISYRLLTYTERDQILVDMLYTGWFKVETPEGPEWRRRLEPHRVVLARAGDGYKIVSGM